MELLVSTVGRRIGELPSVFQGRQPDFSRNITDYCLLNILILGSLDRLALIENHAERG